MKRNKNSAAYKFKIGSNIRKWRNIKDIKQKDLASALQISEAAVSNIENDVTNITVGQLEEISIALNVSLEQLLSDPQDKLRAVSADQTNNEENQYLNKELLNAFVTSLEKKDQQLQAIMQNFIHAMNSLMQQEKIIFNGTKHQSNRA